MRLLSRIRVAVGMRIAGVKAAATQWPENFRKWFDPVNIFSGLRGTLATNEMIFGVISKLSNSMGSLPLALYDDANRKVRSVSAGVALMFRPNPNMHRFDFIRVLEVMRNKTGNGIALIERDARFQPKYFWPVDSNRVTPMIERQSRELWFRIDGEDGVYYVHSSDVIHVKHIPDVGGVAGATYWGISPLTVLTKSMEFDSKVREFSLEDLETTVRASFILKMGTQLDETKKGNVLKSFKDFYSENGGVLLQELGTEITPIEKKLALDPKVFEVEKITRARVAEVFGLPDRTEKDSYSSREQKALEFVQETLLQIVAQYEAEFDTKLLTPDQLEAGLHFKFNLYALLRADMSTQGEFFFRMIRSGVFSPHRVLQLMDEESYDGAETHYVSRDLVPVSPRPTETVPPSR